MTNDILDTVLLFSLPASGKSETRTYMASLTPQQCVQEMAMGPTLQLDDYPYVHLMHRIDDELVAHGWRSCFYLGPSRPFVDAWTWAVLIELLNEDYDALLNRRTVQPASAAQHLMDRLDAAHKKVGIFPHMGDVPYRIRAQVAAAIEAEARHELDLLNRTCAQQRTGKTIVIECARGGPNGAAFPLTPPHGYGAAFAQLSPQILERACVLYIWVDPAESRRKNIERGLPNAQGSILNHSVPMEVMLGQYGTDDMAWLIQQSDREGSIRVDRVVPDRNSSSDGSGEHFVNKSYYLPAARFDNRLDKTSFIRKPQADWTQQEIGALHSPLAAAMQNLRRVWSSHRS